MPNDDVLRIGDDSSIAANAGASVDPVGDVIDVGILGKTFWPDDRSKPNDLGDDELMFEVVVTTAMAGSGAVVTLTFYNHTAATSLASGDIVYQNVFTVPAAGIAAGTFLIKAGIPAGRMSKRYLGLVSSVATANLTAGSVDASITNVKDHNGAHGAITPLS
jgi:hypothetical protein